jgi:cytochrome c-type biogenesis protein
VSDPVSSAIAATAAGSAWAPALAFAAGAATSLGPCVAPRFVAVTALGAMPGAARWKAIAALACGLCAGYALLGIASGLAARIAAVAAHLYAVLAIALAALGAYTLWGGADRHRCVPAKRPSASLGGAFLLGASFALVASPCCTPVIAVLGALAATRSPASGALPVAAYALGHALPLACAGLGWERIGSRANADVWKAATQTVGGGLMLALGAYYGALA